MIEKLKAFFARYQKKHIFDPSRTPSAVLIPLYRKASEYHVLMAQRSNEVKDHKGQIAFPGGHVDAVDKTLADTARRECAEEVGIRPEQVEILGEMDDYLTLTSRYVIAPFVGVIPYPYTFKAQEREVTEIIEVPLKILTDPANLTTETAIVDGQPMPAYFYQFGDKVIWGATARILHDLIEIINSPEH